jgi:TusE/DsrC/DsvC family sulfur relay protein
MPLPAEMSMSGKKVETDLPKPDLATLTSPYPHDQNTRRPEHAMPTTTIAGRQIDVDAEGFLTKYDQWDEELAQTLAAAIGITLTDAHWAPIHFLRKDFETQKETADAASRLHAGGIDRSRSSSRSSPASRPRRCPTSPGLQKPKGCV